MTPTPADLERNLEEDLSLCARAVAGPWAWREFGGEWHLVADYGPRRIVLTAGWGECRGAEAYPEAIDERNEPRLAFLMVHDENVPVLRPMSDAAHPDMAFVAAARSGWEAALRLAIAYRDECARLRSQIERHADRIASQSDALARCAERAPRHRAHEPALAEPGTVPAGQFIPDHAASNLLCGGDKIPVRFPGVKVAVAWLREHCLDLIAEYHARLASEEWTRKGYGLVVFDNRGPIYLATRNNTLLPGMEGES